MDYLDDLFKEEDMFSEVSTKVIDDFVLGEDMLDLRDMLMGDSYDEIENYLTVLSDGLNTTIEVSMWGDGDVDHIIVLTNVSSTLDEMLKVHSLLIEGYS